MDKNLFMGGLLIPMTGIDSDRGVLRFSSADGGTHFKYESGILTVSNGRA